MTITGDYVEIFGMSIRFARGGSKLDGETFIAKTMTPWDYRAHLAQEFAGRGAPAIVHNALGSWFRSLAALKYANVKHATIVIPRDQNFLLTPARTAVVVQEAKIIFLPIYKCGTSSFRVLAHARFKEFADRDPSDSTSLNSVIDPQLERYAEYKKFTFIREPMDRFGSFYRDKLLSPEGSPNFEHYIRPISILMDGKVTARVAADFVALIPPEFCDPHFKPQWLTLTHQGRALVDYTVRLGDAKALKRIGVPYHLPRKLSTTARRALYESDDTLVDAERIGRDYYRKDYRLWRASASASNLVRDVGRHVS